VPVAYNEFQAHTINLSASGLCVHLLPKYHLY